MSIKRPLALLLLCALARASFAEDGVITSCAGDIPELEAALNSINYFSTPLPSPAKALIPGAPIAIISATPEHLQDLLDHQDQIATFTKSGGWVLLNGLTPPGLKAFDSLVGVPHLLRRFRSEKVELNGNIPRIARGMQWASVSMRTETNPWVHDFQVASDAYGWIVDTDNLAPFATLPDFTWFHHPDNNNDHNPYNLVDGFLSNDSWKRVLALYPNRSRLDFTMTFPQSIAISSIDLTTSFIYAGITHVEFTFDGKDDSKVLLETPQAGPAHLTLEKPVTATTITVRVVDWKDNGRGVIGIDEIAVRPVRDQSYTDRVKPVTSIGAIVAYPQNSGGILLCELAFPEQDMDFGNQQRRRDILNVLMRNVNASQGRRETDPVLIPPPPTITLGNPCELGPQAITETTNPPWIDPALSQPEWPHSIISLGGIGFSLGDKPQVILRHIEDRPAAIPINQSARALVFLMLGSTSLPDYQQLAHLTVSYHDGRHCVIPIIVGRDIANYRQVRPQPLCCAQTAWIGRNKDPRVADFSILYSHQWNNPTPETEIDRVDAVCDTPGSAFAILGVTALGVEHGPGRP